MCFLNEFVDLLHAKRIHVQAFFEAELNSSLDDTLHRNAAEPFRRTINLGLTRLIGDADADCSVNPTDDQKSAGGKMFQISTKLCRCKLGSKETSDSCIIIEYQAMGGVVQEAIYLRALMKLTPSTRKSCLLVHEERGM